MYFPDVSLFSAILTGFVIRDCVCAVIVITKPEKITHTTVLMPLSGFCPPHNRYYLLARLQCDGKTFADWKESVYQLRPLQ